ncbi:MAG: Mitochondrial translocator assembly and maintenance protein 41 [Chaenotheca gracillima]|nr:MAG: Mitochondrial translocator assembly and maintenance protein 41 [Chaenotheca gracillima]
MEDSKKSAYGTASSDTSFRRTWDREEYAAKAAAREAREREEGKARYEAKLAGKKYHAPPPSSSSSRDVKPRTGSGAEIKDEKKDFKSNFGGAAGGEDGYTDARAARLNVSSQVGKTQMLSAAQAGVGKRGRGAGFYCDACDLTFKDNLQWVEHLNSKGHMVQTGQSGEVRRVGVEEVKQRLAMLKQRRDQLAKEREGDGVDLSERLRVRKIKEEEEREEKRIKRRDKRRAAAAGAGQDAVKLEDQDADTEMMEKMGFGGFGTTKV